MSSRAFALLCLLVLFLPALLRGQITIHVPADQPTVQAGINAANTGDTVLVAPGTYNENIDFQGKAITVTSSDGAAKTILSGNAQSATVSFQHGETRSSILTGLMVTGGGGIFYGSRGGVYALHSSPSILNNLITGAGCNGIASVAASPKIAGNTITHTHVDPATMGGCTDANGSAIWINGADSSLVPFPNVQGKVPEILGNTIELNTEAGAVHNGTLGAAGISVIAGATPLIQNNVIRNNAPAPITSPNTVSATGGIQVVAAGAVVVQNLVYGNDGRGVTVSNFGLDSAPVILVNNTVANNTIEDTPVALGGVPGTAQGSQINVGSYGPVTLSNNIFSGAGTPSVMACSSLQANYAGAPQAGLTFSANDVYNASGPATSGSNGSTCPYSVNSNGNASVDPGFESPSSNDFHLAPASTLIDAGDNSALTLIGPYEATPLVTDVDGNPRVVDATHKGTAVIDMGAYELPGLSTTSITLVCTPVTIQINQVSQCTATVTSTASVTGATLTYTDNGVNPSPLAMGNGVAPFPYTGEVIGTHTLTVTLPSGSTYSGSSGSFTVQVNPIPPTARLSVTPTSAVYGSPVTLTATVAGANVSINEIPRGTITFLNGTTALGTVPVNNGIAVLTLNSLPAGTDSLSCTFTGISAYGPATCNIVPVTITSTASALTLTSSANPALVSAPPQLTIHLTANGQPAPAGIAVSLTIGTNLSIPLTTDATGSASITAPVLLPGTYAIAATFAGNNNLGPSSASLTQTITGYQTTVSLTTTPNPVYMGQQLTITAGVTPTAVPTLASSTSFTGSVTFYDGITALATVPVSASGQATFSTSTLTAGLHPLTAVYAASGPFLGSTSPVLSQQVLTPAFNITLKPAQISLKAGQTGTTALTLTSLGALNGTLTLSVSGLPTYASASFNPSTVTLTNGATAATTLQITTAQDPGPEQAHLFRPGTSRLIALAGALCPLLLFGRRRHTARLLRAAALLLLTLAASNLLTGCGTVGYAFHLVAPGTYQIPVTATDANHNQQTAVLTLTVTP